MEKILLLGDEAIAQGFIDAGGSAINSYPGTPSTQITEYVIKSKQAKELGIRANWCANEKTAFYRCGIRWQTCHDVYETRGSERLRRPLYECSHYRHKGCFGGGGR